MSKVSCNMFYIGMAGIYEASDALNGDGEYGVAGSYKLAINCWIRWNSLLSVVASASAHFAYNTQVDRF